MAASSRGVTTQFDFRLKRLSNSNSIHGLELRKRRRRVSFESNRVRVSRLICCCSDSVGSGKIIENTEEWRFDPKKSSHRVRTHASPAMPFASTQSRFVSKQEKFYPQCTPRNSGPQSRDTSPKRDTGIANEKDWARKWRGPWRKSIQM